MLSLSDSLPRSGASTWLTGYLNEGMDIAVALLRQAERRAMFPEYSDTARASRIAYIYRPWSGSFRKCRSHWVMVELKLLRLIV